MNLIVFLFCVVNTIQYALADYQKGKAYYRSGKMEEAFVQFKQSAEKGDVPSQVLLAMMYASGSGVNSDSAAAIEWYRKAAENNDAAAQYNLGTWYQKGQGGLQQDDAEAFKWIEKSAKNGNDLAQGKLSVFYTDGIGTPKDEKAGFTWMLLCAKQSNSKAQVIVAMAFRDGGVVEKDLKQSFEWFSMAAENGESDGQYELGRQYLNGMGIPKNLVEAYKWFNLAASQGDADAIKLRDDVEKKMTKEQIFAAQEAASKWFKEKNKAKVR